MHSFNEYPVAVEKEESVEALPDPPEMEQLLAPA